MINKIELATNKIFSTTAEHIQMIGSGFYGEVYLVTLPISPYRVALKLFWEEKYACLQKIDQSHISNLSVVPMPHILGEYFDRDSGIFALAMQYVEGKNLGYTNLETLSHVDRLSDEIVDMVVRLHGVQKDSFGYLGGKQYSTWQGFYKDLCSQMYANIKEYSDRGLLSRDRLDLFAYSYKHFDDIFGDNIQSASLIHGDLNNENIIISEDEHIAGLIDPMGVMYGDREIELFQLECSNGMEMKLLEKYFSRVKPSKNFDIKKSFYKSWAEVNHYARINKPQDEYLDKFMNDLFNNLIKQK